MKIVKLLKILSILSIMLIGFGVAGDNGTPPLNGESLTWLSIGPPLIAIILALITHEAHLALFMGIWVDGGIGVVLHHHCTLI